MHYVGYAVAGFFFTPAGVIWLFVAMLFAGGESWTVLRGSHPVWTSDSVLGFFLWALAILALSFVGAGMHAVVITRQDGFEATRVNAALFIAWVIAWMLSAGLFAWLVA